MCHTERYEKKSSSQKKFPTECPKPCYFPSKVLCVPATTPQMNSNFVHSIQSAPSKTATKSYDLICIIYTQRWKMRPLLSTISQWIFICWPLYFTFHVFIRQFRVLCYRCAAKSHFLPNVIVMCVASSFFLLRAIVISSILGIRKPKRFDGIFFISLLFRTSSVFKISKKLLLPVIFHTVLCVALRNMRNWTGISLWCGDMYHLCITATPKKW